MTTPPAATSVDPREAGLKPVHPHQGDVLAYLAGLPQRRSTQEAAGAVLYLLRCGLTVVPMHRAPHGWRCVVVASPQSLGGAYLTVNDVEITTALPVPTGDPLAGLDPAGFGTVWQTRLRQRFPNNTWLPAVAALLAGDLLTAERSVELSPAAVPRLTQASRLAKTGLRRQLSTLDNAGFLAPLRTGGGEHWGSHRLTLPGQPTHTHQPDQKDHHTP